MPRGHKEDVVQGDQKATEVPGSEVGEWSLHLGADARRITECGYGVQLGGGN